MPRLFVLIPLLLWLAAPTESVGGWVAGAGTWILCFVAPAFAWIASLARARALNRLRMTPRWARSLTIWSLPWLIVAFAIACFAGGWPGTVVAWLGEGTDGFDTKAVVVGTAPAYVAWALVVAGEWPIVRRRSPDEARVSFAKWWLAELRPTLLVTLAPLAVFWLVKDSIALLLSVTFAPTGELAAALLTIFALAASLTIGPPVVRRVLPTEPIADDDGPGGQLYDLVRRTALKCPAGLLRVWHTGGSVINALAVGIVPRFRYVLLSDLLLRSLPVEHVEAVLAHELGHLRHRHVLWFLIFFVAASLTTLGPIDLAYGWVLPPSEVTATLVIDSIVSVALIVGILTGFVLLSRLFERQADVFAARLISPGDSVSATGAW
ncbi:MAG: M48 family metalloprotease, partial [Planctomycetota bacterium]